METTFNTSSVFGGNASSSRRDRFSARKLMLRNFSPEQLEKQSLMANTSTAAFGPGCNKTSFALRDDPKRMYGQAVLFKSGLPAMNSTIQQQLQAMNLGKSMFPPTEPS